MSLLPDRITPVPQSLFEESYGGSLVCCMVMLVLYGLATLQTYMYFLNYDTDRLELKTMVFAVWSLGTIHAIFVCHTVYHYLVLTYTNPLSLIDGEWSVYAATCVGVVVCFIVQIFFARTIYYLTKKTWRLVLTTVLSVLIAAQIAFGIVLSIKLFQLWELPKLKGAVYVAMVPLFTIRVVSDATTAVTLCVVLYSNRSGFGSSIKMVNTLIVYAINRFVLTTIVVIIQTIILIARPDSIWAMVIEFVSVQLYANSFLATLNSRSHLRGKENSYMSTGRIPSTNVNVNFEPGVTVTTEQRTFNDMEGRPTKYDLELNQFDATHGTKGVGSERTLYVA